MKRFGIAVLLLAALALPAHAQTAPFPDIPAGHWALEAVAEISRLGIITGFPDGTFRGSDNLTRYQAALIIQRVLTVVGRVGVPAVDLTALRNAIQELSADLSALNVRVVQLEVDRAALERLRATVAALQAAQAGLVTRAEFTELRNAVAALVGRITPEDLARLQQAIEALRAVAVTPADIAALSQAVAELKATAVTRDDLAMVEDIAVEARATALQALAGVEALRVRPVEPGMDPAALADLVARVEANSVAVETALARTKTLAAAIDEMRAQLGMVAADLAKVDPAAIEAEFLALNAQIDSARQDIIGMSGLIVTLNNESIAQGARLTALEGRVAELERPVEPVAVVAIADQIAAVRDFAILVRRDLVALGDRVTGIETAVAKNAADITALTARVAAAATAADLAALTTRVDTAAAGLTALTARVATAEDRMLRITGNIVVAFNSTRMYASPRLPLTNFDVDGLNVDGVRTPFSFGPPAPITDPDGISEADLTSTLTLSAAFGRPGLGRSAPGGLNVHDISVVFNPVTVIHAGDPALLYPTATQTVSLWTIARFTATFSIAARPFAVEFGVNPAVKFTEYVFDNDAPVHPARRLRGWRGQGGEGIRFTAPTLDLGLGPAVVPGFNFFLGKASMNALPGTEGPWIVMGLRPTLRLFDRATVGFSWVDTYQDHLYGNSQAVTPLAHNVMGFDAVVNLDIVEIRAEFAEAWRGPYITQATKAPIPLLFQGNLAYVTASANLGFVTVNANYRWLTPNFDGVSGDLGSVAGVSTMLYGNHAHNAALFRLNQFGFGANATATVGTDFLTLIGGYDQATEFDGTVNLRGQFKFDQTTTSALTRTSFGAQATVRLIGLVLTAHVVSDAEAIGATDQGTNFQIRAAVTHDVAPRFFIPGLAIAAHFQSDSWTGAAWTNPFGRTDIGVTASYEVPLLGGTITPRAGYSMVSFSKDVVGNQVASGTPTVTPGLADRTLRPLIGFTATINPALNPSAADDATTLNFGVTARMPLAFLPWRTSVVASTDFFSRNLRAIGPSLIMADGQDVSELRLLAGIDFGDFGLPLLLGSRLAVRAGWIDIANTRVGAGPADLGSTTYGYWLTWTFWDVSVNYGAFARVLKGTLPGAGDDRWTWYDGWRISYTVNF